MKKCLVSVLATATIASSAFANGGVCRNDLGCYLAAFNVASAARATVISLTESDPKTGKTYDDSEVCYNIGRLSYASSDLSQADARLMNPLLSRKVGVIVSDIIHTSSFCSSKASSDDTNKIHCRKVVAEKLTAILENSEVLAKGETGVIND